MSKAELQLGNNLISASGSNASVSNSGNTADQGGSGGSGGGQRSLR